MEQIEQLQRTAKEAQETVTALEAVFSKEKKMLDEQDRVLAAELAQVESQHRQAASRIDKGLLERYNQFRAAKKDQALAAVRDGMCAGCRLQIPRSSLPRLNVQRTCTSVPIVDACCTGRENRSLRAHPAPRPRISRLESPYKPTSM